MKTLAILSFLPRVRAFRHAWQGSLRPLVLAGLALSYSSCAIHQRVVAVTDVSAKSLCIIENKAVKPGVLQTMQIVLQEKGYTVQVLQPYPAPSDCPMTCTYEARWGWDLAAYMKYAEIKVLRDGQLVGSAVYDATRGAGNMRKFITAEGKVRELVEQLFP